MEQVRVVLGERAIITHISQDGRVVTFVVAECLCYYLFWHDYRGGSPSILLQNMLVFCLVLRNRLVFCEIVHVF